MSNPFDLIATQAFGVTTNLMGFDATWVPNGSEEAMTARVLYREPTAKEKLSMTDYQQAQHMMEYVAPDFTGLYESLLMAGTETVSVNGNHYNVLNVEKCWDGRTYKARLEPMRDELQRY